MPLKSKTLACIMAFYPGPEFESVCRKAADEALFLLVVDNSPESSLSALPAALPSNSAVIFNKNQGAVAGALNIALSLARSRGYDYLQLLDQDTALPDDMLRPLINDLKANTHTALVAPRFINLNTNHPGRVMLNRSKWKIKNTWPRQDIGLVDALFAITSASVIDIKKIPPDIYYDERLIIDGCDIDFCLALRQRGLEIKVDTAQCIVHGIGKRKDGGGRWSPTNYSPERKFLGAKNRVMVWRRYFKSFPGLVMNDIYVFFLDSARSVLLEKQRLKKLWAILKGVLSGFAEKNIHRRKHNPRIDIIINERFGRNGPGSV
jgi:rhamnosyltransferase